jgi:hypothetical protein
MSNDLEDQLRKALRPVDPGERFAPGVLERVARAPQRRYADVRWRLAAALAVVALGTLAVYGWQVRRAQGLEARRQLIEALQVTGDKLDLAYRAVNETARPVRDPGA